jgi:hypothetical protein
MEIYINSVPIYTWDAIEQNTSPIDLEAFPEINHDFQVGPGNLLP